MTNYDKLDNSLRDVQEVEDFFFTLMPELVQQDLKDGEDVMLYAKKLEVCIPEVLEGECMTWDTNQTLGADIKDAKNLVFLRPGIPNVLGLTIGCIRWRRYRVCLECGWFYCRIVIKGVFNIG